MEIQTNVAPHNGLLDVVERADFQAAGGFKDGPDVRLVTAGDKDLEVEGESRDGSNEQLEDFSRASRLALVEGVENNENSVVASHTGERFDDQLVQLKMQGLVRRLWIAFHGGRNSVAEFGVKAGELIGNGGYNAQRITELSFSSTRKEEAASKETEGFGFLGHRASNGSLANSRHSSEPEEPS